MKFFALLTLMICFLGYKLYPHPEVVQEEDDIAEEAAVIRKKKLKKKELKDLGDAMGKILVQNSAKSNRYIANDDGNHPGSSSYKDYGDGKGHKFLAKIQHSSNGDNNKIFTEIDKKLLKIKGDYETKLQLINFLRNSPTETGERLEQLCLRELIRGMREGGDNDNYRRFMSMTLHVMLNNAKGTEQAAGNIRMILQAGSDPYVEEMLNAQFMHRYGQQIVFND